MKLLQTAAILLAIVGRASATKLPVPGADVQAVSLKTVKEAFKNDYAKKTLADATALAKKLFDAALETRDQPVDRFVLLSELREAAVRAGDVAAAIRTIDQLATEFDVDLLELRIKTLPEIAKAGTASDANKALEAMIGMTDDEIAGDRYVRATQVLSAAKATVRRTTDKNLTARLDQLGKEIVVLAKQYEDVSRSIDTLKQSPDDAAANLTVGKFKCFWKGNWDDGLPKLAKGSDAKLKLIATTELTFPPHATDQVKLGDSLWDLADAEQEPAKGHLRKRATFWYSRAIPDLSGFAKAKAERRVQEADATATTASRPQSREIDLLKLIDFNRDVVSGKWESKNGSLVSTSSEPRSRVEFPYEPPRNMTFKRFFAESQAEIASSRFVLSVNANLVG